MSTEVQIGVLDLTSSQTLFKVNPGAKNDIFFYCVQEERLHEALSDSTNS